jgi:chromosome segregation ATPase
MQFNTVTSSQLNTSSQPYRRLAEIQHSQLFEAASLTRTIPHAGKHFSISDFSSYIQEVIHSATDRIIFVSKQAVVMLYTLQNIERELDTLKSHANTLSSNGQSMVEKTAEIMRETEKRKPDVKKIRAWIADLQQQAQHLDQTREGVESLLQSLMERTPRVQASLESVARVDITQNLEQSEELERMMRAFDEQQLKLYTSLMNAMLTNKRLQDL